MIRCLVFALNAAIVWPPSLKPKYIIMMMSYRFMSYVIIVKAGTEVSRLVMRARRASCRVAARCSLASYSASCPAAICARGFAKSPLLMRQGLACC